MATVAIPGQVIGSTSTHLAGPGTHIFASNIYASIVGTTTTTPAAHRGAKPSISIPRAGSSQPPTGQTKSSSLPVLGSIVLCRVVRVQQRQAIATILVTDPVLSDNTASSIVAYTSLTDEDLQFQAVLRREDIRVYEKDKIVLNEMYRVGDVVRATIISLGDERQYYIGTAGNEFGVVVAVSEDGNAMVPASWKEMRDVVTGKAENRKVAKPT